jgi:hypothetical protein
MCLHPPGLCYETVLSAVPGLHQKPPVWPQSDDSQQSQQSSPLTFSCTLRSMGITYRIFSDANEGCW